MYFPTSTSIMITFTTLAALSSSSYTTTTTKKTTTTRATRRRQTAADPHVVDFRTYGAPGCYAANQGVYTYEQSDVNTCFQFSELPVESIFVGDITDGCSVYAYTDVACTENEIIVPVGIANCYNSTVSLESFQTVC